MRMGIAIGIGLSALLLLAVGVPDAAAEEPQLIAVLDMKAVQANEAEVSALTDRLREELLKTRKFVVVDRSQMEAVLSEQAFQQTGCTEQQCAVQVGQILGVRMIVVGKVTKLSEKLWLVSGIMVDVETARTMRAESVQHQGDLFTLMKGGMIELAHKLAEVPGEAGSRTQPATAAGTGTAAAEKPQAGPDEAEDADKIIWGGKTRTQLKKKCEEDYRGRSALAGFDAVCRRYGF